MTSSNTITPNTKDTIGSRAEKTAALVEPIVCYRHYSILSP